LRRLRRDGRVEEGVAVASESVLMHDCVMGYVGADLGEVELSESMMVWMQVLARVLAMAFV